MPKAVLIVDDERGIADTMAAILEFAGYPAKAVYTADDALAEVRAYEPALIISDVIMPGMNGVELSLKIRSLWPTTKILLMSGNAATQSIVDDLVHRGHDIEVLAKPILPQQLLTKVASILSIEITDNSFLPR